MPIQKGTPRTRSFLDLEKVFDYPDERGRSWTPKRDASHSRSKHKYVIALVAHNEMKSTLLNFVQKHVHFLSKQELCATTSTGTLLENALGIHVKNKTLSGPLGGDQELGGMVGHYLIDAVIFFRDPLSAHPHSHDILGLMRICDTTATMMATNPSTAIAVLSIMKKGRVTPRALKGADENEAVKQYKRRQTKFIRQVVE